MKFLNCQPEKKEGSSGKKVAVIGGGASGLSAAGELVCMGHEVHVFDEMPEAGGFLLFGISSYEIPREGVRERIKELKDAGVVFHSNVKVGKDANFEELIKKYDAVLISTGTWRCEKLRLSGEDLEGVYYALDLMKKYNLRELGYGAEVPELSGRVAVMIPEVSGKKTQIGGDLIAVDLIPILFVQGADKVMLVYKGSRMETTAAEKNFNYIENYYLEYSKEKLEIMEFTEPMQFVGDDNRVTGIEAVKTKLDCDEIKRVEDSDFFIEVDNVIIASPPVPTPPFEDAEYGIRLNEDGTIKTDKFFKTTRDKVFAAGNVSHGAWFLIPAIRSGRGAAKSIDNYLKHGK